MKNITLIIDFDSTFIQTESLEDLFSLTLKKDPEKEAKLAKISQITTLGMEGKLNFRDSLQSRVSLLKAGKSQVTQVGLQLKNQVSPSVVRNKKFFKDNAKRIYIISGGFKEIIWEVVKDFGILKSHILANSFTYDQNDWITGIDLTNLCSQEGGKVLAVKSLGISGRVFIIGDGMTDYQIRQQGLAECFIALTENIAREPVIKVADRVVTDFNEIIGLSS